MNGSDVFEAIGGVDEKLIERAEKSCSKSCSKSCGKSRLPVIAGVCAAAAALVLGGVMLFLNKPDAPEKAAATESDKPAETGKPIVTKKPAGTGVRFTEQPEEDVESYGCYLRVAVYKGRFYTDPIIGIVPDAGIEDEHIGRANVRPEDWRDPEGCVEFMGNFGDYYTVKGVDPRFMICTKGVEQFDDLTYILINRSSEEYGKGADLFEGMLHLSETEPVLTFESLDSWNNGKHEIFEVKDERREAVTAFLAALDESEWVSIGRVYSKLGSYHINYKLACGIGVDLMLYPNGCVRVLGVDDRVLDAGEEAVKALIALLDEPENSSFVGVFPGAGYSLKQLQAFPELGKYVPDPPEGYYYQHSSVSYDRDAEGDLGDVCVIYAVFPGRGYNGITVAVTDEAHLYRSGRPKTVYEPSEVSKERLLADAEKYGLYFSVRFDDVFVVIDTSKDCADDCVKMIRSIPR